MSRFCSVFLILTAWLVNLAAVHGEDTKMPRTDRYGDPLPSGAVARLGTIRLRHTEAGPLFSKDGKQLISCGTDGEVRVWDTASGKLLRRTRLACKPEHEHMFKMAVSPDGATVAAWHIDCVTVYDAHTGKERGCLPCAGMLAGPLLVFSPDGKLLIVQESDSGNRVFPQVWDVAAVKRRCRLGGSAFCKLRRAVFSPDGKRVVGRGDYSGRIHLWDANTGVEASKEKHGVPDVWSLAVSPDGKMIAVGAIRGGGVHLLDGATLQEKSQPRMPAAIKNASIDELAFSPDGRWLAVALSESKGRGNAYSVILWDMKGLQPVRNLPGGLEARFAFTSDSKTLAYSQHSDDAIHLVDTASGQPLFPSRAGHKWPPRILAASPDGKTLVSADLHQMLLWDVEAGKPLQRMMACDRWASRCLFSPDGRRMISAGFNGTLQVWNVASGKEERRLASYATTDNAVEFYAAGFSADGKRLQVVADSWGEKPRQPRLIVWDLATGERTKEQTYPVEQRVFQGPYEDVKRIEAHAAFTPDGEIMTAWEQDRIRLKEVYPGALLPTLPKGMGKPLLFSPDGRIVAATITQRSKSSRNEDRFTALSLLETATGEEITRLEVGVFNYFAFTPDGRGIVTAGKKSLCVWDSYTGERLYEMTWPDSVRNLRGEAKVCSLAVLPGSRAATGMTDSDILIWNLAPSNGSAHKPEEALDHQELDALWTELAGDARSAYRASAKLAAAVQQSVPFLKDHVRPAAMDAKHIEKILTDLDSDSFAKRESASRELLRLRYRADTVLRRALLAQPSLEMRRRLDAILAKPKRPPLETLRTLRAIAVLERIGTPEAQRILEKLAGGVEGPERHEAKKALRKGR